MESERMKSESRFYYDQTKSARAGFALCDK